MLGLSRNGARHRVLPSPTLCVLRLANTRQLISERVLTRWAAEGGRVPVIATALARSYVFALPPQEKSAATLPRAEEKADAA